MFFVVRTCFCFFDKVKAMAAYDGPYTHTHIHLQRIIYFTRMIFVCQFFSVERIVSYEMLLSSALMLISCRRCCPHFPIFRFCFRVSPAPPLVSYTIHLSVSCKSFIHFLLHFSFVWKFCVEQVFLWLYLVFVLPIVFFFFTFTSKLGVLLHIFVLRW